MANKSKRTEHAGAKHGRGAYYGHKADAKAESNKARRRADAECGCSLRIRLVGDGCPVCNPEYWAQFRRNP